MAFHYYTGSDISEQREPAFWRREPRWPIGTFDGPAKMAKQGIGNGRSMRQWQEHEASRGGHNKILEYARKIPKILTGWGNF